MAIALAQSITQVQVDGSSATSFNLTINGTVGGNALVWVGAVYDSDGDYTITGITDSGNTWTVRNGVVSSAADRTYAAVGYAVNITGGNRTVTISLASTSAGANRYLTYGCFEFSGVATSTPEDTWDANDEVSIATNDLNAGPITTTDAGDLLVGAVAIFFTTSTNVNFASPTSWTNSYRENNPNAHASLDAGYWIPGSVKTTYTAQWVHDNEASREGCGVVVALKPAAGGANPKGPLSNPFAGPFGGPI
jgi:hypothetical protein